ncbi:MAG: cob(I)yrinic acid a,c-diamide adenosyltransferase [Schwartzia sp.]|nr:cob(I)yrinic acid a,c-diamide adenosyltransferase [Schwartzia sp. (in: firmicutes)]
MRRKERQGLLIVHTGEGKGKTTAALGLAVRAWGSGLRVLILQFIKGGQRYGELDAIKALKNVRDTIEVRQCGLGFTRRDESRKAEHIAAAKEAVREAEREIVSGAWDLIILDEINYAVKFGLLATEEVLRLLREKPPALHLVLTGRDAQPEIVEAADLVTEMKLVKHPFEKGVKAQKGIEF